jgi:carbon monoxide dehydrogenase subunit G
MARMEAVEHIEADPARVWDVLVDWEGQTRWMRDAQSVRVVSPHRDGVDVVVRARMTTLGVPIVDEMVTTQWLPAQCLAVRHLGPVIHGVGAFELHETAHGTRIVWWEEAQAPLGWLGESVAQALVAPYVERVFRADLALFKRVCESTSVRPAST